MAMTVPEEDQRLAPGEARLARTFYLICPVKCKLVECFVPFKATPIFKSFQIILAENSPEDGAVAEFENGLGAGEVSSRTVSFNAENVLKIYVKNPSTTEYLSIDELHIRVEAVEEVQQYNL